MAALLPKRRWTWRWRAHGGRIPMAAGSGGHPFAVTWVEPGVAKPSSGKIDGGVAFRGGGQIRGAAAVAVTCSGGREEDGGCGGDPTSLRRALLVVVGIGAED